MDCSECESEEATPTEVVYEVEKHEVVPLCEDCRDKFRDGDFIQDISVVDQ